MKTSEKICDAVSRHFSGAIDSPKAGPLAVAPRCTLAATPSPLSARVKHLSKFRASAFTTESALPNYRRLCTPRSMCPTHLALSQVNFARSLLLTEIPGRPLLFFAKAELPRRHEKG